MIPDWEVSPYTLDFISYSVGEEHSYPRFLCYECHGERSYNSWNPYSYACTDFRVVVWDDPYYYPAVRYSGTRVVFSVPLRNRPRYTVVNRKPGEGWSPLVRFREPPPLPARAAQFKEPDVARGIDRRTPPRRTTVTPSAGVRSGRPNTRSVPARRPSTAPVTREGSSRVIQSRPTKPARAKPSSGSASTRRATGSARAAESTRAAGPTRRTPTSATPTRERPYSGVRSSSGTARPSLLRRLSTAVQNTAGSRANTGRSTRSTTRTQPARTGSGASRSRPTRTTVVRPPTRSSPVTRPPATTRSRPSTSRPAATTRARPTTARGRPSISSRPTSTRSSPPARPTVRARPTRPPPRRGGRGG